MNHSRSSLSGRCEQPSRLSEELPVFSLETNNLPPDVSETSRRPMAILLRSVLTKKSVLWVTVEGGC